MLSISHGLWNIAPKVKNRTAIWVLKVWFLLNMDHICIIVKVEELEVEPIINQGLSVVPELENDCWVWKRKLPVPSDLVSLLLWKPVLLTRLPAIKIGTCPSWEGRASGIQGCRGILETYKNRAIAFTYVFILLASFSQYCLWDLFMPLHVAMVWAFSLLYPSPLHA